MSDDRSGTILGNDLFGLRGRVALVTGASRNIGAAIARAFAHRGADLLLIARDADRLETVAEGIRADTGRHVRSLAIDVAAPGAVDQISEQAEYSFGKVDVLVNNAYSVGEVCSIFEADDDAWADAFGVNVMAPMRLCRHFGNHMRTAGGGSIINLLSGSGFLPSPHLAAYGASKAALWMLTRYLAVEGAPSVRANAVCPGLVSESGQPRSASQRALLPHVPMRRVGLPHEVVGAAIYLASDASTYTTGEVIFVNGGRPW